MELDILGSIAEGTDPDQVLNDLIELEESKLKVSDFLTPGEYASGLATVAVKGAVVGGAIGALKGRRKARKMGLQGQERKEAIWKSTKKGAGVGAAVVGGGNAALLHGGLAGLNLTNTPEENDEFRRKVRLNTIRRSKGL